LLSYQTSPGGTPILVEHRAGPTRAALVFRAGQWDEPLHWAGVTHLVEHVACAGLGRRMGRRADRCNAMVTGLFTRFMTAGTPAEVGEFLAAVTSMLHRPPVEHMTREAQIIRVEAQGRGMTPLDALLRERYGPVGPGLSGYAEHGLRRLGEDDLRAWAGRYFTADNAVLVISGEVPGDLRLDLPPGTRRPPPALLPLSLAMPAYEAIAGYSGVAVSAILPRSTAAMTTVDILRQRLFDLLRSEHGLSYHVQACYDVVNPDTAHVMLGADADADGAGRICDMIIAEVDRLARDGATGDERAEVLADNRAHAALPDAALELLDASAREILLGRPALDNELHLAEIAALTSHDIAACAAAMGESLFTLMPAAVTMRDPRFVRVPQESAVLVRGSRLELATPTDEQRPYRLIAGDEGISLMLSDTRSVTVTFAGCAAVLLTPGGRYVLIGQDNFHLSFDANQWVDGARAEAAIRAHVAADRFIPADSLPGASLATAAVPADPVRAAYTHTGRPWRPVAGGLTGGDPTGPPIPPRSAPIARGRATVRR
jgi:predicted Zn-dependent peptidase